MPACACRTQTGQKNKWGYIHHLPTIEYFQLYIEYLRNAVNLKKQIITRRLR